MVHALIGLFWKKVGELYSFPRPSSRSSLFVLGRDTWGWHKLAVQPHSFGLALVPAHAWLCDELAQCWPGRKRSLFFRLILCWINRLSQCIMSSNTQWCLGITGSEGYGLGFWWWGLVLQLLCLHPLRGILGVSKEVGCCLISVSISDKGLKMNLAGNCPDSYGTHGGTWLWAVSSPQISVCSMLPLCALWWSQPGAWRPLNGAMFSPCWEKGSGIRKRSFWLSASVNRLNPSFYFFTNAFFILWLM